MAKQVTLKCQFCHINFLRLKSKYDYDLKTGRLGIFCSIICCDSSKSLAARLKSRETAISRFWSKVDKTPGLGPKGRCWEWTGKIRDDKGYGRISYGGRSLKAHQFSYLIYKGPLPNNGCVIRHRCDNSKCVRPSHLLTGTHRQNMNDAVRRGRFPVGSRHYSTRLSELKVLILKYLRIRWQFSQPSLGIMFNISTSAVQSICKGRVWKHIPQDVNTIEGLIVQELGIKKSDLDTNLSILYDAAGI